MSDSSDQTIIVVDEELVKQATDNLMKQIENMKHMSDNSAGNRGVAVIASAYALAVLRGQTVDSPIVTSSTNVTVRKSLLG
jgi:hypothetical protein